MVIAEWQWTLVGGGNLKVVVDSDMTRQSESEHILLLVNFKKRKEKAHQGQTTVKIKQSLDPLRRRTWW